MKNKVNPQIGLSIIQVQADMHVADDCIKVAERSTSKMAKPFKGQAGYHLQQAAEKLIKMQIYNSGKPLNYSKLYKHSLDDLVIYAQSLNISLVVPKYIRKQAYVISSWEARGRYDLHLVIRIDVLKRAYSEIEAWYKDMVKLGYK